ncbi:hypothetical protein [Nocardia asiatica]|uniref:hypothetical protein n=1 Tax=Nocardia asiatica TaxID=209252 RepID=UPI002454C54D|nr:hypothetical protein [Nocardia asiatica]
MTPRRIPGAQLPLLIKPEPDHSSPEIDAEQLRALLESMVEGLKRWDGTTAKAEPTGEGTQQGIRELMDESIRAFAELGIRVQLEE